MKCFLLVPSLTASKGGVETYCKFLLEGLLSVKFFKALKVFSKLDCGNWNQLDFIQSSLTEDIFFWGAGAFPDKLRTLALSTFFLFSAGLEKPDLIIVGHPNLAPLALLCRKFFKIPYWVVAHGIDTWYINKESVLKGVKYSNLVVAVSNYTKERILNEKTADNVVVLSNTFRPDLFAVRDKPPQLLEKYKLLTDQPIILTVARLGVPDKERRRTKGYEEVIAAMPKVLQAIPNTHYILVGEGSDRGRVQQIIKDLGIENNVTLAGFIPDNELPLYYNLCDVFAMPSIGEGFGIVYLEALACGKPCIGGNQDGAIDALLNGELGVLVNPNDIDEISETIVNILHGSYLKTIFYQPETLRSKVIEAYGFDKFKKKLLRILSSQLS